jgi:hypothetical protein
MNSIPQEIKSPIKLTKRIFFRDLIAVFFYWSVMSGFESLVNDKLQILYTVFNLILPFFVVQRSPFSGGRYIWQSLLYCAVKDRKVYHTDFTVREGVIGNEEKQ